MVQTEEITELFKNLVKMMVDKPDEGRVVAETGEHSIMLKVIVGSGDAGKLIGQSGRTARSLRVILQAVAVTNGLKLNLDLGG